MKYCIDLFEQKLKHFKYLKEIDEITIKFNLGDATLVSFLQAHTNQRINIFIDDEQDFLQGDGIKLFTAIRKNHPELTNYVFKLKDYRDQTTRAVYKDLKDNYFSYFFGAFVSDWDTFNGYIDLGVTDIYITEALGFEIKSCAALAHDNNVRVRVFPNIAQSAWKDTEDIIKFFIRPEDVAFYEPYIDVLEFWGESSHLETFYRIYAKDKKWFGDLQELILDFHIHLDSRCLLPKFAEYRSNCGKKCIKGGKCNICFEEYKLSEALAENHVTIGQLQ